MCNLFSKHAYKNNFNNSTAGSWLETVLCAVLLSSLIIIDLNNCYLQIY